VITRAQLDREDGVQLLACERRTLGMRPSRPPIVTRSSFVLGSIVAASTLSTLSAVPVAGAADFVFSEPIESALPKGQTPTAVRAADLTGDGVIDLVVAGRNWNGEPDTGGRIAILRGAGDGTFEPLAEAFVPQGNAEDIGIADLDGDGVLDLAVSVGGSRGRFAAFRGLGGGSFAAPLQIELERGPRGLALSDLDGDGDLDATIVNYNSASVSIVRNDGGVFTQVAVSRLMPYLGGIPFPQQVSLADLDADGDADAIATTIGGGRVTLLRGGGDGGLARGVDWKPALINGEVPAVINANVVDMDGDGDRDVLLPVLLLTQTQKLVLFVNDGTGSFSTQAVFDAWVFYYAWCSTTLDVDRDGRRDVAIGTALSGSVSFVRNETPAPGAAVSLVPQPLFIFYGFFVRDLIAADVDNDGDDDVVGIEIAGSTVFTLRNDTPPAGGVASLEGAGRVEKRPARDIDAPAFDFDDDGDVDASDAARWLEEWTPARGMPSSASDSAKGGAR
jgi:hypothetical protein